MIDRARINRLAAAAHAEIAQLAKAHIETSNRSFGQLTRYTRERFDLAKMEQENLGDEDLLCCSGLAWGDQ